MQMSGGGRGKWTVKKGDRRTRAVLYLCGGEYVKLRQKSDEQIGGMVKPYFNLGEKHPYGRCPRPRTQESRFITLL